MRNTTKKQSAALGRSQIIDSATDEHGVDTDKCIFDKKPYTAKISVNQWQKVFFAYPGSVKTLLKKYKVADL